MDRAKLKIAIDDLTQKIGSIANEEIKEIQNLSLNLIESLVLDNDKLREENQKLRDENNILKGEQGKPNIRKQTKGKQDVSSEEERKSRGKKKKKNSKKKKHKIKINRVEICEFDKSKLPHDAEFKGYQSAVVQDILIKTDNIKFKKKIYYC